MSCPLYTARFFFKRICPILKKIQVSISGQETWRFCQGSCLLGICHEKVYPIRPACPQHNQDGKLVDSLDLKDAYLHVSIHRKRNSTACYLNTIQYFDAQDYRFYRLGWLNKLQDGRTPHTTETPHLVGQLISMGRIVATVWSLQLEVFRWICWLGTHSIWTSSPSKTTFQFM